MTEHFTREKAYQLADMIRRYWNGKFVDIAVISDPYAGFIVRSNMLNGCPPQDKSRPVYVPEPKAAPTKRWK